jgi:hypothetical protein
MSRYNIAEPPYNAIDGASNNTIQIQAALTDARDAGGGEVFFPKGQWNVNDLLLVYSNTILTGEGPGSVVAKTIDNTKVLFHIYGTGNQQSNIVFRDLHCRGVGVAVAGTTTENCALYALNTDRLSIRNCYFTNFRGNVLALIEVRACDIRGNYFFCNTSPSWADIHIGSPTKELIIRDNFCMSNNDLGIFVGDYTHTDLIISGNVVVPLNTTGVPITGAGLNRRHSISVGYGLARFGIKDAAQTVISNNICHLCRWSGIYSVGDADVTKADDSGGRLVVTGNLVSAAEQQLDDGAETLRGGITISSAREAVIRGNVVVDQPSLKMPGIRASPQWSGGDYLVTGNLVKNVQGPGIYLGWGLGNSVVSHNTLVECGAAPDWPGIFVYHPIAPVAVKSVAITAGNSSLSATSHGHKVGDRVRIINGANYVRSDLTNDTIFYLRDDTPPATNSFEVTLGPGTPVLVPTGTSPAPPYAPDVWPVNERGGMQIVGNHIEIHKGTLGIYLNVAEPWPVQIRGNYIRVNVYRPEGAPDSTGIQMKMEAGATCPYAGAIVTDNVILGAKYGIVIHDSAGFVSGRRLKEFQFSRNTFINCTNGFWYSSENSTGLLVFEKCRFMGVTDRVKLNASSQVFREGRVEGDRVVLFGTGFPTTGTYVTGDRVVNQGWSSTSTPIDWFYTGSAWTPRLIA